MAQGSAKDFHAEHSKEKEIAEKVADLRFMIEIHVTNGLHLFQKSLSYPKLKKLVEKLEVLC